MKASELARVLNGALEGCDVDLFACAGLEEARPGDLSFCKDAKHVRLVETTKASAVLLPPDWTHGAPCAIIRVADPNRACMAAAKMFAPPEPVRAPGVHPSAIVDPSARLGAGVHVGPFTLIPSFCGDGFYGLHVHEAALAKGVKVTGATVHFVNEITDGGKIILQKAVEVKEGDTPEVLQRRVMEEAEWKILPQAVEMVSKQLLEDK